MSVASSSSAPTKALRRSVARMEAHLTMLDAAHRRVRLLTVLGGPLLAGTAGAVLFLVAGRYVRVLYHPAVVVVTLLACSGIVLWGTLRRRRGLFDVAVWVDLRAGLDERVSSALAFLNESAPTPMMHETVRDAEHTLLTVDRERVDPRVSRRSLALLLLLLPLPFLAMLPPRPTPAEVAAAGTRRALQATGRQVVAAAVGLQVKLGESPSPDAQGAVTTAQQAGAALADQEEMSREAALEQLRDAREQIEETLHQDRARELLSEQLRENAATRAAGEALAQGDTAGAADELRAAAAGLEESDLGGAGGQQLADELRAAAQTLPPGAAQAAANRAAAGAEAGRLDTAQEGLRDLAAEVEDLPALGEDRVIAEQAADALRDARDQICEAPADGGRPKEASSPADAAGTTPDAGPTPSLSSGELPGGGQTEPRHSQGRGGGVPELGDAVPLEPPPADAQIRVEVAGQLLAGERTERGPGGRGPVVHEDDAPDMRRTVQQFQAAGEAEIVQQAIPPGYRALVRDYYRVLEEVAAGVSTADAPETERTK